MADNNDNHISDGTVNVGNTDDQKIEPKDHQYSRGLGILDSLGEENPELRELSDALRENNESFGEDQPFEELPQELIANSEPPQMSSVFMRLEDAVKAWDPDGTKLPEARSSVMVEDDMKNPILDKWLTRVQRTGIVGGFAALGAGWLCYMNGEHDPSKYVLLGAATSAAIGFGAGAYKNLREMIINPTKKRLKRKIALASQAILCGGILIGTALDYPRYSEHIDVMNKKEEMNISVVLGRNRLIFNEGKPYISGFDLGETYEVEELYDYKVTEVRTAQFEQLTSHFYERRGRDLKSKNRWDRSLKIYEEINGMPLRLVFSNDSFSVYLDKQKLVDEGKLAEFFGEEFSAKNLHKNYGVSKTYGYRDRNRYDRKTGELISTFLSAGENDLRHSEQFMALMDEETPYCRIHDRNSDWKTVVCIEPINHDPDDVKTKIDEWDGQIQYRLHILKQKPDIKETMDAYKRAKIKKFEILGRCLTDPERNCKYIVHH